MNVNLALGFFGQPLGRLVNKGIGMASTAIIAYSVGHGNPLGDIAPAVSMIAVAISMVISGFASTQGVTIPIINRDETNGVKVVRADTPDAPKVNAPLTKAR